MAYCRNCGKEIDEQTVVCPQCGVSTNNQNEVVDNGSFGWGLFGCCFPIVGLALFLVWKDTKPKSSKAAGIGALISVCFAIIYYIG